MGEVTIIIPVKDEEVGLEFLLDDYRSSSLKDIHDVTFIFVIDKRTSDSSKKIASEFSENIIDQEETTGKGSAVRQAIDVWRKNPTQMIVFLDADGSYSFDSVIKILDSLEEGADLVSGSRFLSGQGRPEGMSRLHNFGNRVLSAISSVRNRRRISDLCTGLWGFNSQSLMKMDVKSRGFDLEAELAGIARRQGLDHIEVQVDWSQRKGGTSKLRSLTDGFIIFLRIIRT
tara:strand:- start:365 stop:1054 length:690 start_codon:yes stop_codon:yes gene_type:complete